MHMFKKLIIVFGFLLLLPTNLQAADSTYDLGITQNDISFSKELVAGQKVRMYAAIHNYGREDVIGYVTFYQGNILIGDSQVISVRAGSLADEVYVDWEVPSGSFNIRAEINGQDPKDENSSNDLAITTLFIPLPDNDQDGDPDSRDPDDDNDGISDDNEKKIETDPLDSDSDDDGCLDNEDDFPLDPNLCFDSDNDGIDDKFDPDDDNDGWSDEKEDQVGTNPKNPDTDNDGVIDSKDAYPLDPNRSKKTVAVNTNKNSNINNNLNSEQPKNDNINTSDDTALAPNIENEIINLNLDRGNLSEPFVNIIHSQIGWKTYVFKPEARGLLEQNLAYHWEFGDGAIANEKVTQHVYEQPGNYQVSLKIYGNNDIELSNSKKISISFFNFANPTLWSILGGLMIFLLVFFLLLIKRGKKD